MLPRIFLFFIASLSTLFPFLPFTSGSPVVVAPYNSTRAVRSFREPGLRRRSSPLRKRAPVCQPKPTSTAPKPSATPKPGTKGKAGLAWYNGNDQSLLKFINQNVRSAYTWSEWEPDVIKKAGLEFMPMMWGPDSGAKFDTVAKKLDANYYLGFNECNEKGQSNMNTSQAISLWKKHLTPLQKKGKKTVCPAMSSRPNGLPWVQQFLKDCGKDCDCDVIALHWYDNTIEKFKAYLNLWHNAFPNKPIWVTEFACQNFNGPNQPSLDYIQKFMKEATTWMDSLDWVERYFAFGVGKKSTIPGGVNANNAMMLDSGEPNQLGKIFIGEA